MINNDDCERYQDILDRLFEGSASDEDVRRLRGHADRCPDCAALLELHRELHGPTLTELEAAVPDRLVDGMWPRVELELMKDDWREAGRAGRAPVWRWVVAAQAAAIVLLAAGALYLFDELESVKNRDASLTSWMASQQNQLTELQGRTSTYPERIAAQNAGSIRERRLDSAGDVTVGEATRYLRRLPADTRVLDARGARRLVSSLAGELPQSVPGAHPEQLAGIELKDGLQAGEALALLAALELDPSSRLPAGGIVSISKRYD